MVGPFINPDHLGGFLAISIPLAAGLFAHRAAEPLKRDSASNEWSERLILVLLYGVAMSALVAALIGSTSRAALLAAFIGCGTFWWGTARSRRSRPAASEPRRRGARSSKRSSSSRRRALEIAGRLGPGAMVVGVIALGLVYAGSERRTALDERIDRFVEGRDFAPRVERWRQTLPIIADFPVFGVGAGSWREIYPSYRRFPIVGFTETHVHNDYVEWVTEVGLAGLGLTLLLGVSVCFWARRNDSIPRRIRWGLVGALVAVAFHEIFDFVLRMPANAILVSVIVGLLCNSHWSRAGSERDPEDSPERSVPMRGPAFVAAGVCIVMIAFSSLQLAEFFQWREAFWGSRTLLFASHDA
ncbi:MAG: O-antigen ligase family protein, partial [Candidatus Binatia bacterium]